MTGAFDVVVLGGGIAGASVAAHLAPHLRVALLEREDAFAYHATGRSAAMFVPSYGGPEVRALSAASEADFHRFNADGRPPVFRRRAALHIASADQLGRLDAVIQRAPDARRIDAAEALRRVPVLRRSAVAGAVVEERSGDLDVAALFERYLSRARAHDAVMVRGLGDLEIERSAQDWRLHSADGVFSAPVLVNATGAWADETAVTAGVRPLGLTPMLRSVALIDRPTDDGFADWPTVMDVDERFYFRPFAGRLLLTACDESASPPCDAACDELATARAMDRFLRATNHAAGGPVRSRWGGLRTFTVDRVPRIGWADDHPGFFWVAGLGGFGIQTSPAVGRLAATAILRRRARSARPIREAVRRDPHPAHVGDLR